MTKAKNTSTFLVDGYEPETKTVHQFHGCHWHGDTCLKSLQKSNKRDKRICVILISSSKIMDGIQSIILCQSRNVKNQ